MLDAHELSKVSCNYSYAADILSFLLGAVRQGEKNALIVVTAIEGGGIRAPGALMAVTESGRSAGYVSNGCVDSDVIYQSVSAISEGRSRKVRYGIGSPFIDVQLPCGGSLDLLVLPEPDGGVVRQALEALKSQRPICLEFSEEGLLISDVEKDGADFSGLKFIYHPAPKVEIIGRGVESLALARLAQAADMDVHMRTLDDGIITSARSLGVSTSILMDLDEQLSSGDHYTAYIFMLHDIELETKLLKNILSGPAFYIGVLGSQRSHERRCDALRRQGLSEKDLERISAPMGMIPSARDAGVLAISTLAELTAAYRQVFS